MSIVKVKNLIKRFGQNLAVDNLSLCIDKGEIFGLVGPNGAGKSTTIKMLVGLLKPDSGEILIDDKNIATHAMHVKKRIGLVPQDLAIYENISAIENVKYFGSLYGLYGRALEDLSEEALEFVGLLDRKREKPKRFSGGMKRRLNIACSIVHKPKLIIMDEPTVGIDTQSRNYILESVKDLNSKGTGIVYTSHYMEEVEAICDCIGIIDMGKLIAVGGKEELKMLLDSDETITIETRDIPESTLNLIRQAEGVTSASISGSHILIHTLDVQRYLQGILNTLNQMEIKIVDISIKKPNLEDVFLSLTGRKLRD
ncbi:MAG: ABC transporter ATP-binding protein [Clostridia bacterium]|nr:ABC transporter ATP-binding protein [Clostridia bacterium]